MAEMNFPDPFLTRFESRQLQGMFEAWLQLLKPDIIEPKLYQNQLISQYEQENFGAIKTGHEKSAFIFHNVLMKATYNDMCTIRDILLQSGQNGHKHLAKLMPKRGENIDYEKYTYKPQDNYGKHKGQTNMPQMESSNGDNSGNKAAKQDLDKGHQQYQDVEMQSEDDILDLCADEEYIHFSLLPDQPSSNITDPEVAQQASGPSKAHLKKRFKILKSKINNLYPVAKAAALPDYSETRRTTLPCYPTKPQNRDNTDTAKFGKGLCVIIRNFTEDLIGYENDAIAIERFFKDKLHYEVWSGNEHHLVDLCRAQFYNALNEIQNHLKNRVSCSYVDRFFLFILSHGDEQGVKTCKLGSKREEEIGEDNQPVRISVEEIVKTFTHDKVELLKGFPKCFMIQACQGTEVAKPAAGGDAHLYTPLMEQQRARSQQFWVPPSIPTTIGADVLICLPSEKGTYSWVPSTGSWFIRETMALLEQHYKDEHLVDIMVQVNDAVGKRQGKGQIGDREPVIDVVQMPGMSCTLTKKFYLSIPQNNMGAS